MGLFGPPNVEKMQAKGDVKGLIKALGYRKDRSVREAAAGALGQIGDARAVEPLISALQDGEGDVSVCAKHALTDIGKSAVEPLIAVLRNGDTPWLRHPAAEALGRIGDARAVEPLIAALKDSNKYVREGAAVALRQIGWRPGQDESGAAYFMAERLWDKCVEMGASAVEPLIAALKDGDTSERAQAAGALGRIADARAVEALIVALVDDDRDTRQSAAGALKEMGEPAIQPLIAALKNGDTSVRQASARALGNIGASAVDQLISVLKDGDGDVRCQVAELLRESGDTRAIEPLVAALEDSDARVRRVAVGALYNMGWRPGKDESGAAFWVVRREWDNCIAIGAPAVEPLIVALNHIDGAVRRAAAGALDKIGWRPGRDERAATYRVVKGEFDKCIDIGAPAVAPLITALGDGQWPARKAAAEVLVMLYQSNLLDQAHKHLILIQRGCISRSHDDLSGSNCCFPTHTDTGIGVAFPV